MKRTVHRVGLSAVFLLLLSTASCGPPVIRSTLDRSPTAAELAELWAEPVNAGSRDLFYGIGGADLVPDASAPFDFVADKEDHDSYSSGCTVRDPNGLKWSVKFGAE